MSCQPQGQKIQIRSTSIDSIIEPIAGVLVAFTLLMLWACSLGMLLAIDLTQLSLLPLIAIVLGRTLVHTGLFITAHDAMHGNICPRNRQLNHGIGWVAITLYGFLPYRKCTLKHWQHHRNPGQESDPDFHDGTHQNAFAWYLKFMNGYLDVRQKLVLIAVMSIIFHGLRLGFHLSSATLLLFWVLPIVLSSIQLFIFGTYLPHRGDPEQHGNSHHATSSNFPLLWSFFTCYHFGYHWEHHEYPDLAWYELPTARSSGSSGINSLGL